MHSAVTTAHPLRSSWRSIRNKIRICRQTQYDIIQTYFSENNNRQQQLATAKLAIRPRFVTNAVEQQIYSILVTFLDQVVECYHTMYNIWVCKKFGRQLARILRAINFDHGYCWRLLENRILYYLMVKHYSIPVLLAWHKFMDTLSDAVIEGFWQATTTDLPKQLPTIFEDTPAKCFLDENLAVAVKTNQGDKIEKQQRRRSQRDFSGSVNVIPKNAETYRVLYAYKPRNADELELEENDIVFVIEKCDDGWFIGTLPRTGQFGTFPGNYVERH
ncbi:unnamed protein product [Acanthocheilonema viteae]|uniref:SH3 domain-containing protein n=1 Tax=Acanthocheilonema viteae TaxID=6277 RepID=A0A498SG22_ACAVI|nr:unnamed protein product [Acanthocheilonema viteae]